MNKPYTFDSLKNALDIHVHEARLVEYEVIYKTRMRRGEAISEPYFKIGCHDGVYGGPFSMAETHAFLYGLMSQVPRDL